MDTLARAVIGWAMTRASQFKRNYKKSVRREVVSATMSEEDIVRQQRLDALRKAIEGITTRAWSDDEWQAWLKQIRTK